MVVDFTDQEIKALRILLHRACLHSGMDVAEAAVALDRKFKPTSSPIAKKELKPAVAGAAEE